MTDTEKITLVRNMLDDSRTSDDVIQAYLDTAQVRILEARFPFKEDLSQEVLPTKYEKMQCELAVRMLSRRGFEGQVSSNENGVIRQWGNTDDIDILGRVVPVVGV